MGSDSIEYRGVMTEDDFVFVSHLQRLLKPNVMPAADMFFVGGVVFAIACVWHFVVAPDVASTILWTIVSFGFLFTWWHLRPNPRKAYRENEALRGEHVGRLTDSAIESRLLKVDARIPWAFFTAYAQRGHAVILIVGEHLQVTLVKSFFATDDDWNAALRLVGQHLQRRTVGRLSPSTRNIVFWFFAALIVYLFWEVSSMIERPR